MGPGTDSPRLRALLSKDERLLWSGRPPRGLLLRAQDAYLVPFSLLFCGFFVFWMQTALRRTAPTFFLIWGSAFALFGLYLLLGRFAVDALQRGRTEYGVTSERVIIVSGLLRESVVSLPLRSLSRVTLTVRGDGSGDIEFGERLPFAGFLVPGWPGAGRNLAPVFERIPGAREVHERIREAQAGRG